MTSAIGGNIALVGGIGTIPAGPPVGGIVYAGATGFAAVDTNSFVAPGAGVRVGPWAGAAPVWQAFYNSVNYALLGAPRVSAANTGGIAALFRGLFSGGTFAAPTAVPSGQTIAQFDGAAFDGTAFGSGAAFALNAAENWAVGAHGCNIGFAVITRGTTGLITPWRVDDRGHFISPADGTYDIGSPDAGTTLQRPRDLYLSRSVIRNGAAVAVAAGQFAIGGSTQTTVGAAGGASALPLTPLGYLIGFAGATKVAIPYYNG